MDDEKRKEIVEILKDQMMRNCIESMYYGALLEAVNLFEKEMNGTLIEVRRCKDCRFFKYGDYCTHEKMEHSKCRATDYCNYALPSED